MKMTKMLTGRRSYLAMLLSMMLPGLGQLYLRRPLKGIVLFIGVVIGIMLIYANSLPVNSWRDLTRLNRIEPSSDLPSGVNSETEAKDRKRWRGYPLYTSDRKFMFRIGAEFQSHLVDGKALSAALRQEFKNHNVLAYKGATISTKREGSWWLIDDNYQTYSVRKSEYGLDIYSTAQWRFRPRWQFKITGLIQMALLWGYAIFDGWLGRREK